MKSDRAIKLEKLRAKASPPNSDADRLAAISRCANMTDLGRPSRDFMRDQLREIESRNTDPTLTLRISEIRDQFAHSKGVKQRRLERRARETDMINEPIEEQESIEAIESAPAQQESDDNFALEYPPTNLLWPPDPSVYVPGWIDTKLAAQRLIAGGVKDLNEAPSRPDVCERIIKIALDPNFAFAEITLAMLQRLWFALQGYEPRPEDPRMPGHRHRFWVFEKLHASVYYIATKKFGWDSLKDAPPSVSYVRDLLKQESESSYVRLEALPRAIAAARLYRHLPGFNDLLKEIQTYEENKQ